jgi:hypothetical protein
MQDNQSYLGNFDDTSLVNINQKDDIIETQSINEWIVLSHDQKEEWKNILVKLDKQDVHVMNKRALNRVQDTLLEYFNE